MTAGAARVAAVAAAALAFAGAAGCGADKESAAEPRPAPRADTSTATTAAKAPRKLTRSQRSDARAARLAKPLAFHLRRAVKLRARPGGKTLRRLGRRTTFGSPRIMAVVGRRAGWVAVRTEVLRGRRVGWVPSGAGMYYSEPRTIEVDLSRRQMTVRHRGKVSGRYRVAVGAPGTPTPKGHFAVTDRLHTGTGGSGPYGCCILALTGHQPKIAQGWGGGDRIAIHGTAAEYSLGQAVSHGCVRATNATLRRLMRQIRLGTPVWIHA
jgi:lipoprotein-anchoring transpeptidase ErfK/SrfK